MLEEHQFNTGAVVLNYAQGPDTGPPLVLVHGGAARWQDFLPIIPTLAVRWQVYALDLRGHGSSGWTPGHYRLDDNAADLNAFLDRGVAHPAPGARRDSGRHPARPPQPAQTYQRHRRRG